MTRMFTPQADTSNKPKIKSEHYANFDGAELAYGDPHSWVIGSALKGMNEMSMDRVHA